MPITSKTQGKELE
jgi:hypothetical protein